MYHTHMTSFQKDQRTLENTRAAGGWEKNNTGCVALAMPSPLGAYPGQEHLIIVVTIGKPFLGHLRGKMGYIAWL